MNTKSTQNSKNPGNSPTRATGYRNLALRSVAIFLLAAGFLLPSLLMPPPARAANKTFTGPGNFSAAANWGGALPQAGDNLTIVGTCHFDNAAANHAYGTLTLGNGAATAGTVDWPVSGTNNLSVASISANVAGSGINMTNGGTLQITGSWSSLTNMTFTPGTGTVNWNVTGATSYIYATTFNNLTITAGTRIVYPQAATTIGGNFVITSGTYSLAFGLAVTGATTVNGKLTITSTSGTHAFSGNVTINSGGTLSETAAEPIAYSGDITINSGGTLTESGAASMSFAGSFQNDGTYAASTGAHTFSGTGKTFSGTGAISITSLTMSGTYTNNGTLTVATRLGGSGTLTQGTNATLNIGDSSITPTIVASATGNTVGWSNAGTTTLKAPTGGYYNLHLSGGTKNSGAATIVLGNLTIDSGATLDVTAGNDAWSIGGNWTNNGTLTQRKGTITLNGTAAQAIGGSKVTTFYNLTLSNTAAAVSAGTNFNVSTTMTVNSGAILVPDAAVVINSSAAAGTITGSGTIKVTRTAATPDYSSQYKFSTNTLRSMTIEYSGAGDQTINSTATTYGALTTSGSGVKTMGTLLTVNGDVTIGTGTTLNTSSSNYKLAMSGNFINNGTFAANASTIQISGSSTTASIAGFSTTGGVNFSRTAGTATLTGPITAGSLTMNALTGATLNLGSGLSHQVTGNVTYSTSGTLDGASSTLSLTGNFTGGTSGTFAASTGTVAFNGSSGQTIDRNAAMVFNNLTINNTAGVALNHTGGTTVNGTLTLTGGTVTTASNSLIIASGGSVSRTSGHVIGNLVKAIDANGTVSRTFEVGTGSDYTPINVTIYGVAGSGGTGQTLTGRSTSGEHPSISASGINSSKSVNRYWTLTRTGSWTFTSYDATFNFVTGDVDGGATAGNFVVRKYSSGAWSLPPSGVTAAANSTTGKAFKSFSDFAVGEGNWESYSDSARTTVSNNFSSTPGDVYMRGTGLASTTYNVRYFDSDGSMVPKYENVISLTSGNLDTTIRLSDFPSATTGTWHSLVQPTSATSFDTSSTYSFIIANADIYGVIADDTFVVTGGALPELPTAAVGPFVLLACFAIYYWRRKKVGSRQSIHA